MTDTHHPLLHAFAPPAKAEADFVNIVRGEGSLLWDDAGNEYVDGLASLWYCQVGHGRAEIVDAVAEQMRRLEAYNIFDPFTIDYDSPTVRETRDILFTRPGQFLRPFPNSGALGLP